MAYNFNSSNPNRSNRTEVNIDNVLYRKGRYQETMAKLEEITNDQAELNHAKKLIADFAKAVVGETIVFSGRKIRTNYGGILRVGPEIYLGFHPEYYQAIAWFGRVVGSISVGEIDPNPVICPAKGGTRIPQIGGGYGYYHSKRVAAALAEKKLTVTIGFNKNTIKKALATFIYNFHAVQEIKNATPATIENLDDVAISLEDFLL